jgi:hypothetical protein
MSEKGLRGAVIGVDVFEALSGFVGAVGLMVGFMNIPVSVLSGTPFVDFTVPALILGVVVGGSALVAAILAAYGPRPVDALATLVAGGITVGYLIVEIALIGLESWAQVVWLLVGLVMIGLGTLLWQAESYAAADVTRSHQPV